MSALSSLERLRLSEEKAKNWIDSINPDEYDDLESVSSIVESSLADTSDSESEIYKLNEFNNNSNTVKSNSNTTETNLGFIQNQLQQLTALESGHTLDIGNITIENSSNIVVGSIININHDLTIDVIDTKNEIKAFNNTEDGNFAGLYIVPRTSWSTRIPKEPYDLIEEPVKIVLISHTATASSTDQSENIELIKDIQEYHIDTYGWNEIAYNFLIGEDGNIYEGRGWGIEGAHCFGYNSISIGISFIGCFMKKLPTEKALKACKDLLRKAVEDGHISKDYKLLGHRQCSTTESPGSKLYEEIQTWKQFYNKSIDDDLREDDND